MRVNVNIPDGLLKQIDDIAKSMYMTRTDIFLIALNNYLEQKNAMDFLKSKQMEDMMNLMFDNQKLDK